MGARADSEGAQRSSGSLSCDSTNGICAERGGERQRNHSGIRSWRMLRANCAKQAVRATVLRIPTGQSDRLYFSGYMVC